MTRLKTAALATCSLLTACRSRSLEAEDAAIVRTYADELGPELLAELSHVLDVLTPGRVLVALTLVAFVVIMQRVLLLSVRIAWRLGWDPQRRLARIRSLAEIVLLLSVGLLLVWMVFKVVPLLTCLAAMSIALIVAVALPGGLQDFAAGISLANRSRFLEGDQIEVGPHSGTVRHIGLVRTMLRLGDRGSLWIPNREVVRSAVMVGREQQALPLTVELPGGRLGPDRREHLRQVAHLSPYRRAGSRPTLEREGDRWTLSFQTWCTRRPEIAARSVERQLADIVRQWEARS
ncbi:MAG: mechanosensitive ion channel domain-containing protein [Myxococcota bacterium]